MKRIITLSLLLFFLYNAGGYYFCYKYYQSSIRREIKQRIRQGLSNDELTEIIVNDDGTVHAIDNPNVSGKGESIQWTHAGKEFKYGDAMFDVVRSVVKSGKTHYFCINDTKDKRLLSEFMKLRTRKLEKRVQSATNLYFFDITDNSRPLTSSLFLFGEPKNDYTFNYPLKFSPPPKGYVTR